MTPFDPQPPTEAERSEQELRLRRELLFGLIDEVREARSYAFIRPCANEDSERRRRVILRALDSQLIELYAQLAATL